MIVLAELSPLDPVTGSRVTLRASSANLSSVTGLNDVIWRPAISEMPTIGIRLFKGDFDGTYAPAGGSMAVQIDQLLALNANARRFAWQGAQVKLYAGIAGQAWPWTQVFAGRVDKPEADRNKVKLTLGVDTEPFEKNVLTAKYAGTSGAEGGADLKGKVKPLLFGRCLSVEPVLINAVDSVFQFSAYGAIQAVNALYERGSAFGAPVADYASYALLVAATIAPGKWATCLAEGLIRLGAPPYGVITGDVDGDKAGGTWRRKTGEVILRAASLAGVSSGVIESSSFTALDTALSSLSNQGRMGIYLTDQISVIDLAAQLAAPCNAQVGVSMLGKIFVSQVAIGSPTITLDAQQRQLPRVTGNQETGVTAPWSYIEMGFARCWRVHTNDEIATEAPLRDLGLYDPATTYREGNIVTLPDGGRYRYISTTPTAGNIPPNATYWDYLDGTWTGPPDIYDAMDVTDIDDFKTRWSGIPSETVLGDANFSLVASTDLGGQVVQVGDNSGNDYLQAPYFKAMPFDPEDLYEVLFDVEFGAAHASAQAYFGVRAENAAGANLSSDSGTYCYSAVAGFVQNGAGRITFVGYMRGRAAVGAGNGVGVPTSDRAAPCPLPNNTVTIRPLMLLNFPGGGAGTGRGIVKVHLARLRKVDDATLIPTGPWDDTRTYHKDEGVEYGGSTFGSKVDGNLNHQPPDTPTSDAYWYLVGGKGTDGDFVDFRFTRSAGTPSTPTGDDPSGWYNADPGGAGALWFSKAKKTYPTGTDPFGTLIGSWSTPAQFAPADRGEWASGTQYYATNTVRYDSGNGFGTYVATVDNIGHAPSGTGQPNAYWDVVAAPGSPGTPATPPSAFSATINLTSSSAGVNLRSIADANGYTGMSDATITFNVPSGVNITGLAGGIGIDSGTWPSGYAISIALVVQNGGVVWGGGGKGGDGSNSGPGLNGQAGGDAVYCRQDMSVTIDSGGTLKGAGGGGGGGGTSSFNISPGEPGVRGGSGGGGGVPNGPAGIGATSDSSPDGSNGTAANTTTAGSGGTNNADGGNGATFATAGSTGQTGSGPWSALNTVGGGGGAAGYAVRKNGKTVTVTNNGTMTGTAA